MTKYKFQPITDEYQLAEAQKRVYDLLMVSEYLSDSEQTELDSLTDEIKRYERKWGQE